MLKLLVKVRILSAWNTARRSSARSRMVTAGLAAMSALIFVLVFYGFSRFLGLAQDKSAVGELVYEIFYFLFLFLLAGAVPFVASTLLHSGDYLLLAAAPLRSGAVVAAKLLDATVTNSLQFMVIGLPAVVACAVALGLRAVWWPLLVVILALFVLLPALLTAATLLVALAVLGARRVRGAIASVNMLMAAVVCLTIVMQVNRLPIRHDWPGTMPYHGIDAPVPIIAPASAEKPSSAARTSPSAWFATSLIALAEGRIVRGAASLAGAACAVSLLFGACVLLGRTMLDAAAFGEEDQTSRQGSRNGPVGESARRALRPSAALVGKDLRYVCRDTVLLGQLGMPLILCFVPYALAAQQSLQTVAAVSDLYRVAMGMTGIILFLQTSILSLSSIGLESRGFWMMLTAPTRRATILWSKFAMSTLVSGGIAVVLTLLNALVFRADTATLGLQCLVVAMVAAGLCGIGVGTSAALPRFVYENPAHRVSPWAMIFGFVATFGYVIVTVILFASMYFLSIQLVEIAPAIYLVGATAFVFLTAVSVLLPMLIGARRLDGYQWVY